MKKHIGGLVVMLMLAMQLLLAQHYTVHFNEDKTAIEQQQPGHDAPAGDHHDKDRHDKICQICVFSKSLSHLALSVLSVLLLVACATRWGIGASRLFILRNTSVVYPARGPPAFLS